MTKIKVCGLRRPEDIAMVNEARPDFIGFIFDDTRRRYIEPAKAAALRAELSRDIQAVGVFVNAHPSFIRDVSELAGLDLIQLHGQETKEDIKMVQEVTRRPVIKAFRVETKEDLENAAASSADYVLLDNGAGGTGESFDWSLLRDFPRPFILAGGIGPENAAEAIAQCTPWGLDASSSLETDHRKDAEKINEFIARVRRADSITSHQTTTQEISS